MQINGIKATNMELSDAIKKQVEDQIDALEKLTVNFEPAAVLDVEVGKTSRHHAKGPYFFCEMNLEIPGQLLRSIEEKEDLYEAIDAARDAVRRQLLDHKEKLIDRTQHAVRPDKE